MRISDWSSDVCSSDLVERSRDAPWARHQFHGCLDFARHERKERLAVTDQLRPPPALILRHSRASPPQNRQRKSPARSLRRGPFRSEEHTSELQSLMRHSYAVFCLKKNTHAPRHQHTITHTS